MHLLRPTDFVDAPASPNASKGFRPQGIVRLYEGPEWKRGKLLWERKNLFVNAGLIPLASLIAGVTSGQFVAAAGFGSGSTPVTVTDTDLTTTPKYYNAIGAHTIGPSGGLSVGSVQFAYALGATDYGATGLTIQELGLFAGTASLPVATGTANPSWAASTGKTIGNLIVDSNLNIQRCTTNGNTGTGAPSWATTVGTTTNDFTGGGTAVWTCVALHTAPTPMICHVVVPSFAFTPGVSNYSGTWTLTF
jgi:hypothetical protein